MPRQPKQQQQPMYAEEYEEEGDVYTPDQYAQIYAQQQQQRQRQPPAPRRMPPPPPPTPTRRQQPQYQQYQQYEAEGWCRGSRGADTLEEQYEAPPAMRRQSSAAPAPVKKASSRPAAGSQEARDRMAYVRSHRGQKQAQAQY